MRFGLVGTGPWARHTHGPVLGTTGGVDLVGVWGRDPGRTRQLAGELGVEPYDDYDQLLGDVEAMAFAVPPDVQAERATAAARAGKHLLLDKPVALSGAAATALADEVDARGLASVVFFTTRFSPETRDWCEQVRRTGGWRGGWARWLAALETSETARAASPWRHEQGALWDVGPHALATLSAALGPVTSISAAGGQGDLVHLVLHHDGGPTSTVTLTLFAPRSAASSEVTVWGPAGLSTMPSTQGSTAQEAFSLALAELIECASTGQPHPVDVRFGAEVVRLLQDAQEQLRRS